MKIVYPYYTYNTCAIYLSSGGNRAEPGPGKPADNQEGFHPGYDRENQTQRTQVSVLEREREREILFTGSGSVPVSDPIRFLNGCGTRLFLTQIEIKSLFITAELEKNGGLYVRLYPPLKILR